MRAATVTGPPRPSLALKAALVSGALGTAQRRTLQWPNLVVLTALVMLFIPARRYVLSSGLPFELDPYRLAVGLLALGWMTSLLIDPRVRLRRTGLEGPLALYVLAVVGSLALNPVRASAVSPVLTKTVAFWVSFFLLLYVLPSVLTRIGDIELVCKAVVTGGALVAATAIVESRTHYNVFNHLTAVAPFLDVVKIPLQTTDFTAIERGGALRAYASGQHPIALGGALAMLIPLAAYLAKRSGQRRWWICATFLLLGLFATVSRTGFLMLVVALAVFLWLRPREVRRYWPAIIPAVVVIHVAVPGTLGSVVDAFFPRGGLIGQQTNTNVGSGRLATLKPVLRSELYPNPVLGEGFGTRIAGQNGPGTQANAPILDNQWAGVLVETGIVGALAWAWMIVRAVGMLARRARANVGDDGWLPTALAASIASFGVGMFVYDAFSFIQVTFLFFLLLGLTGALHARGSGTSAGRSSVREARDAPPRPT